MKGVSDVWRSKYEHTYEEGQNSRRIKAKPERLHPQEGDAGGWLELASLNVLLAAVAGDDS